jgi:transcriptional regulator with XRE-family HTH domain
MLRAVPLSQTEISRLTGIPQPRISRWEAGQVPRSVDDVLKLQALQQRLASQPPTPAASA